MIVGITGASGIAYGIRLLEVLRLLDIETHLVVSRAAELTRAHETDLSSRDVRAQCDEYHFELGHGRSYLQRVVPNHRDDRGPLFHPDP